MPSYVTIFRLFARRKAGDNADAVSQSAEVAQALGSLIGRVAQHSAAAETTLARATTMLGITRA
ncbi:hypothetical protein E3H11_44035, partial [Bradyrhizobium brasilense]|uniref:hypothetical protein n=1 Tax=Bradyrhizobium brasilense TaxID=1419277 RepID=UPI001456B9F1